MKKRLALVIIVTAITVLAPYYLGLYFSPINNSIGGGVDEWIFGFALMIILMIIVMVIIRLYQYIRYGW